jgi:hypothetical protein
MMGSRGRNVELESYPQNGNHKQRKRHKGLWVDGSAKRNRRRRVAR